MLTLKYVCAGAIASIFVIAATIDNADAARRGGGGGGVRAGGLGGGGAMRAGGGVRGSFASAGPRRAQVSRPIARARLSNRPRIADRPGIGSRPDGGFGWANRPDWNPGWGYGPGLGWGAAALGGGLAAFGSAAYGGPAYGGPAYGGAYYSTAPADYYEAFYDSYFGNPSGAYGAYAAATSDAAAACAQRFRSYDPASGTYLSRSGQRVPCP
jgi:BA14K-like protein